MSSHIGVSCDSCLKTNFSGRRYKCLSCDNYDLCGLCYDNNLESQNHLCIHPMQCILSKTAHELFYGGETISHRSLIKRRIKLLCVLCAINPVHGTPTRFVSLADHLVREHDDNNTALFNQEQISNQKNDFDQNDDDDNDDDIDEDEGLPLYILAERLFAKEETRRPIHTESTIRNYCNSVEQGNGISSSQRRSLSRHVSNRGSRRNLRSHFNHYPYGTVPRTTTTGSLRTPFDTTVESSIPSDPYAATILFSQDPLFDFESSFSDLTTNASFFLTSALPNLRRVANDRVIPKKSTVPNVKQKCLNSIQQSMILTESLFSDNQFWEENFPPLVNHSKPSMNTDLPTENKIKNESRSLLRKILKNDCNTEQIRLNAHNHTSFFQSLFLSSLNLTKLHLIILAGLTAISLALIITGGWISAWCIRVGNRFECYSLFQSNDTFSCLFKLIPTGVILCLIISLLIYCFDNDCLTSMVSSTCTDIEELIIARLVGKTENSTGELVFGTISSKDPLYLAASEAQRQAFVSSRYNLNHGPNLFFASFVILLIALLAFVILHRVEFA
ncbi:hypothetical protein I4U23_012621 [Adineta vaga]|nr:hypothetical protein I4U23_012621 [Adineta vaga]